MRSTEGFDDAYVALFTAADQVARRILGDAARAEDVAAETLARALVGWGRVGRYAEPWVVRVATNLSLDLVKRKRVVIEAEPAPSPEDEVLRRVDVLDGLRLLARRQAQVVALRYLVGFDDAEIGETLGISPETVKTHGQRGLARLRARLPAEDDEEVLDAADPT